MGRRPKHSEEEESAPKFLTYANQRVLFYQERFFVEVTPRFQQEETMASVYGPSPVKFEDAASETTSPPPTKEECYCGRPIGHRGIHRGGTLKKSAVKRKGSGRQCGVCSGSGHNAATCPERKGKPAFHPAEVLTTENKMDGEDLKNEVQRLQEKGLNSLSIAQRLHIPLAKVNKFWKHALANDVDENEG